jgi:pimeloyl-ACP methyl ester carboxylesterase
MTRVTGDGISLAVLDEGEGQPVLLLHGFPDSSRVWRHQIPAFVAAGMRVIAPDLRGFGESDKPEAVEEYAVARSVADIVALLEGLGIERTHVVGHDWGAAVAWALAATFPARVERLVAMSVAHPNTNRPASIEQREKGWYQLLFQFTGVAEELLARDGWKLLREILAGAGDLTAALQDLSRPGALTAALNWYRANLAPRLELEPGPSVPPVAPPTLGLWSTGDRYLTEDRMVGSAEHVTGPWRYARIEGASHWMQLDATQRVNDLLLEFLVESELPAFPRTPARIDQ